MIVLIAMMCISLYGLDQERGELLEQVSAEKSAVTRFMADLEQLQLRMELLCEDFPTIVSVSG